MDRRKFLERIGIGAITLAVVPKMISNSDLVDSDMVTTTGSSKSTIKGEQSPFIRGCVYHSHLENRQYYAVSEEELVIVTDNWSMSSNLRNYPNDLKIVYSACAEI